MLKLDDSKYCIKLIVIIFEISGIVVSIQNGRQKQLILDNYWRWFQKFNKWTNYPDYLLPIKIKISAFFSIIQILQTNSRSLSLLCSTPCIWYFELVQRTKLKKSRMNFRQQGNQYLKYYVVYARWVQRMRNKTIYLITFVNVEIDVYALEKINPVNFDL